VPGPRPLDARQDRVDHHARRPAVGSVRLLRQPIRFRVLDIMRAGSHAAGITAPANRDALIRVAGFTGHSLAGNILSNTANKVLQDLWPRYMRLFGQIAKRLSTKDFKDHTAADDRIERHGFQHDGHAGSRVRRRGGVPGRQPGCDYVEGHGVRKSPANSLGLDSKLWARAVYSNRPEEVVPVGQPQRIRLPAAPPVWDRCEKKGA